jgi:hypothetical protein
MLSFNIILIASVFAFPILDKTFDARLQSVQNKPQAGYVQQASNDDQEDFNDDKEDFNDDKVDDSATNHSSA